MRRSVFDAVMYRVRATLCKTIWLLMRLYDEEFYAHSEASAKRGVVKRALIRAMISPYAVYAIRSDEDYARAILCWRVRKLFMFASRRLRESINERLTIRVRLRAQRRCRMTSGAARASAMRRY